MPKSYADQIQGSSKNLAQDTPQDIQEQVKENAGEAVDYVRSEAKKTMADPQVITRGTPGPTFGGFERIALYRALAARGAEDLLLEVAETRG